MVLKLFSAAAVGALASSALSALGPLGVDSRQPEPQITAAMVHDGLARQGYYRIKVMREGDRFTVGACRGARRVMMGVDRYGDVSMDRRIGWCFRRSGEWRPFLQRVGFRQ